MLTESFADIARRHVNDIRHRSGFFESYGERLIAAARLKDEFAAESGVHLVKWSSHNLARMLRATGASQDEIGEMRDIIAALGAERIWGRYSTALSCNGVFDHPDFWAGPDRMMMVGAPHEISTRERALLADLAKFPGLRVAVDDRPSYYGFGSHHVRIALAGEKDR